jgi:uncharacterized protein (DUF1800 family)
MPADSWSIYSPDGCAPWNLRRVVHLHRRAGFAATWDEIQRDLKDGPKVSIDRVLCSKASLQGVPENYEATAALLGETATTSNDPLRMRAAWVFRMLFGPDPLAERLTLLWHNHFATSNLKVDNLSAMWVQNELFRKYCRKPFGELLNAAMRDPALLVWLDAPVNRKGKPNENLARELMELFSMGIGAYTEADVKEAARALTGWTVHEEGFTQNEDKHDDGDKIILGKKGKWHGADLIKLVLDHPATAKRLAWRIGELLLSEKGLKKADLDSLAEGLSQHNLDIAWGVETVMRSRAFFTDENIGGRVLSPVDFVVGAARALELFEPASSTLVLSEWCGRLGQDLFYPPNVGGWPGGRAWLTTRALLGRANYAVALVEGKLVGRPEPMEPVAVAKRHKHDDVITFYTRLLLGTEATHEWRQRLTASLGAKAKDESERARRIVSLILAMPEAQIG